MSLLFLFIEHEVLPFWLVKDATVSTWTGILTPGSWFDSWLSSGWFGALDIFTVTPSNISDWSVDARLGGWLTSWLQEGWFGLAGAFTTKPAVTSTWTEV